MNRDSQPRRRLAWRFSLRSLFLAMFVVGVFFAWYARPREKITRLDDGWQLGLPANGETGPCVLLDRFGRTVCRGQMTNGWATGTWTYFHENGRVAWRGEASKRPLGNWTAWSPAGRRTAEFTFSQVRDPHELRPTDRDAKRPWSYPTAPSNVRTWWENGQPRLTNGEELAATEIANQSPMPPRDDAWFRRCVAEAESPEPRRRQAAIHDLIQSGPRGLPHLSALLRRMREPGCRLTTAERESIVSQILWHVDSLGPQAASVRDEVELWTKPVSSPVAWHALQVVLALAPDDREPRLTRWLREFARDGNDYGFDYDVARLGEWADKPLVRLLEDIDADVRLLAALLLGRRYADNRPLGPVATALRRARDRSDFDPRVAQHLRAVEEHFVLAHRTAWLMRRED